MAGRAARGVGRGEGSSDGSDAEREYVTLRFGTPRASEGDFDVVDAFTGGGAREAHASPGSGSGASAPGAVRLSRLTDDLEMLRSEVTALRMMWSSAAEQAPPDARRPPAAGGRARRASAGEVSEAGSPSPPPSPRRGLPTGDRVRLLAGAQGSAALPPRPAGASEASARLLTAVAPAPAPAPTPRVLDMRVPALHRRAPGEADAPLRLLQRPGAAAESPEPACAAPLAPLSREAAQLKASFDAAVAATEARLRAALTEALRESTNLRLARAPHAAADAAAAAAHRDALALRNSATTAARPASPPASSGAEAQEEDPRAVAEREDPFVPLWQWAAGRPARLADLYRDAEAAGAEALPRSRLAALVATLAPAADARALRYVAAVLDADGAGDAVPLASFVHAVREGASAGAAARADAHAGLERCLVLLRRSLDAQPEAWAFQFRCAPGGALSPAQVLAAACAVLPELTGRQRVLFAAAIFAEGSFGGPRHTFTLPQLMILCAPRAQRSRRSAAMSAATPKPVAPVPPAEPARPEEQPRRPQPTEPPPERVILARKKRAHAEAAAAAAMAAAAAAAAAAGVVREELQRAQAARERAALEPPPPPLPLPLPSGTRAELSAAEAEEAAGSAAPRPAAKARTYALPPMHAREEATESSDALGYSSTDASSADVPAVAEATAAPVAHPSPAAKPAAPPVPDAERAKRSAARARSLLKDMQAAIGAAAANADTLRGDISSNYELLASTRTQLCAPSAAPLPFVQHQTWRR